MAFLNTEQYIKSTGHWWAREKWYFSCICFNKTTRNCRLFLEAKFWTVWRSLRAFLENIWWNIIPFFFVFTSNCMRFNALNKEELMHPNTNIFFRLKSSICSAALTTYSFSTQSWLHHLKLQIRGISKYLRYVITHLCLSFCSR